MWKKRMDVPEEGGVRIPDAQNFRRSADSAGGIHVESARKKNRRQIAFTAVLVIALFSAMIVYFCNYAISRRSILFDNDYNHRDILLEKHNRRGTIYSEDGEILAQSDEYNNRSYPYAEQFCHVVGYSKEGGSGIEEYMKYELLHSDIPFSSKLYHDRMEELYPGNNVYTTLNVSMQQYAYEAIGEYRGAVVVTDPSTGRILAMVSKPDFDPNAIVQIWEYLRTNQSGNSQLLNRATQGIYAPGSTFKIIDAVELLQEDPAAIYSFSFDCEDGIYENGGESIHCFDYEHHHSQNLEQAFANSCNSAFASIVTETLDKDRFRKTLKRLLFEQELPYDLPSSESHSQLLEDQNISTHNLMQVAIGQGTTGVSPLHMNMITMAVANDGVLMRPHLIDRVVTAEGRLLKEYQPKTAATFMDRETAQLVRRLMANVTRITYDQETGRDVWGTASIFDGTKTYTAYGKTGTAEFGDDEDSHGWFTGFATLNRDTADTYAPGASGPDTVCITVLIENGGTGSDKAVPVAKQILDRWYGENQ